MLIINLLHILGISWYQSNSILIPMARIKIIEPEAATGTLKEVYDALIKSRGKIAEVHKIHSLNPEALIDHMALYMTLMFGKSPIKRAIRELMAVVVSKTNACNYCVKHHGEALNFFWKDSAQLDRLIQTEDLSFLDDKEQALCAYAKTLTEEPNSPEIETLLTKLKALGYSDTAIHDATAIIAYFNFVNRMVLGLDVKLEENYGGYKY